MVGSKTLRRTELRLREDDHSEDCRREKGKSDGSWSVRCGSFSVKDKIHEKESGEGDFTFWKKRSTGLGYGTYTLNKKTHELHGIESRDEGGLSKILEKSGAKKKKQRQI